MCWAGLGCRQARCGSGQGRVYRGHCDEYGEEGEAGEEGAAWDDAMDDAHDRPESYYSCDDTALTNPAAVPQHLAQHDISLSQAVDLGLLPPRYGTFVL